MKAPFYKWILAEEAKIGKKYIGYKTSDKPDTTCLCEVEYLGDNKALVFGTREVDNVSMLERHTTYEEQADWNKQHFDISNSKTQLSLYGLFTDLYDIGDANHEMCNSWVTNDFYEMNVDLLDEDFILIGIAPAPYGCPALDDPIAFVIEYENGERFWCHGGKSWVDSMREDMREIYNQINEN